MSKKCKHPQCWVPKCQNLGDTSYRLISEDTGEFFCDLDDMPMPLCPSHVVEMIEEGLDRFEREQNERKKMDDRVWPTNEDLVQYVKEGTEHRRAWALNIGLSKTLLAERKAKPKPSTRHTEKATGPKPQGYNAKIRELEHKIIQQKKQLRTLEVECRPFERETERKLVDTLESIRSYTGGDMEYMRLVAIEALIEHQTRLGPRPK